MKKHLLGSIPLGDEASYARIYMGLTEWCQDAANVKDSELQPLCNALLSIAVQVAQQSGGNKATFLDGAGNLWDAHKRHRKISEPS